MEQDIKRLEELKEMIQDNTFEQLLATGQIYEEAIENFIKGYIKLEEENEKIKKDVKNYQTMLIKNYISKFTIKHIVEDNLRTGRLMGEEFYVFDFNGCQHLAQEIVQLLREG